MRGSLAVRLDDGLVNRHVPTRKARGLRFTKTAPGGFHSGSVRIDLPRDEFPHLGPNNRIYVYDKRNGRVVWDGYTDNPGASDGSAGQGFELSAMGGMVRASDESRALVYIDRGLEQWTRASGSAASASTDVSPDPTGSVDAQGLLCQLTPGQPVTTNSRASISYLGLENAGLEFGAMSFRVLDGKTDANYSPELYWAPPIPVGTATLGAFNSNDSAFTKFVGDASAPPSGAMQVGVRLLRAAGGATTVADDTTWAFFYELAVLMRRVDRDGNLLTGAAGMLDSTYVAANWVVEDLIGRMLTFCDPLTAENEAASIQIDQLAYHDGTTAAQVLEDLMLHDSTLYWGIGETLPNGLHRFWMRSWPDSPLGTPAVTGYRYEISTRDNYSAPGGDSDLCNRIAVFWTDEKGIQQTTVRTSSVDDLGGAPGDSGARTRDADPITLPEGRGSLANAERIGDAVLASKAAPPKAGTAVVSRPILDHDTGNTVMPWEIEPGYNVMVRETGDVLRLTEFEYVDDDVAATLTLGEPVLTIEQRIARLSRV